MSVSFFLVAWSGCCATELSGQGNWPPKKDFLPHWPFIAHRPASCLTVQLPSFDADVIWKKRNMTASPAKDRNRMNPHSIVMCCEATLMERDCGWGVRRPGSVLQLYSSLREWKAMMVAMKVLGIPSADEAGTRFASPPDHVIVVTGDGNRRGTHEYHKKQESAKKGYPCMSIFPI